MRRGTPDSSSAAEGAQLVECSNDKSIKNVDATRDLRAPSTQALTSSTLPGAEAEEMGRATSAAKGDDEKEDSMMSAYLPGGSQYQVITRGVRRKEALDAHLVAVSRRNAESRFNIRLLFFPLAIVVIFLVLYFTLENTSKKKK